MLRGPGARFFIKFYRTGMIRDGKIRDGLVFFPPLLEERVNRLQLGDIVSPGLHHGGDAALIDLGRADDVKRVPDHIDIASDTGRGNRFHGRPAVAR